jgi:cobalt/nickel transport system permease protein
VAQTGFLDKTLLKVADIARQSLFSEAYAQHHGLLQSLDVRTKVITFLFILVLISFLHTPHALLVLYLLSLVLAFFSRISLPFFVGRVWLFVPLFTAAIVLPAILNIITPGDPLWVLVRLDRSYSFGPYAIPAEIAVTRQGLWGGITIVSRVAASVSFVVLFTLTTRWSEIFAGLRSVLVPRVFVVTLSLTHRYLFVLIRLIQDMYRARKSRTFRPLSYSVQRNWIASRIGVTFNRSLEMSEDIYRAMISRGFRGDFRMLDRFHVSLRDAVWLASVLCCSGIMILLERSVSH